MHVLPGADKNEMPRHSAASEGRLKETGAKTDMHAKDEKAQ